MTLPMASDGLVDLHCHLLPGVDDGAKTPEEALEMAKLLLSHGFTKVAPSPHNRPEYAARAVADQRLVEMRQLLDREGVPLELFTNAENFLLDPHLLESLGTNRCRPIGPGPFLLAEAPYTSPFPALPQLVFRAKLKGTTLVIAHPERCLEFHTKGRAESVVHAGAILQLDIGTLIGRYGRIPKKLARQFLQEGLYGVAATDLHSPLHADWIGDSLEELRKLAGDRITIALLRNNPGKILRGEAWD